MFKSKFNALLAPACSALGKAAVAALLVVSASAQATVLFNSVNASSGGHSSLSFFATDPTTTISIGAYNTGDATYIQNFSLQLGGAGPNLLGSTWNFSGPGFSNQYDFGGPVNSLVITSPYDGRYDTFSQSISLNKGSSYQISFDADIYGPWGGNGLRVETNGALTAPVTAAVPEPETYAMMLAGLGALGAVSRRKRAAK